MACTASPARAKFAPRLGDLLFLLLPLPLPLLLLVLLLLLSELPE